MKYLNGNLLTHWISQNSLQFINVLVRVSITENNFEKRIIKLLNREVGLRGKRQR